MFAHGHPSRDHTLSSTGPGDLPFSTGFCRPHPPADRHLSFSLGRSTPEGAQQSWEQSLPGPGVCISKGEANTVGPRSRVRPWTCVCVCVCGGLAQPRSPGSSPQPWLPRHMNQQSSGGECWAGTGDGQLPPSHLPFIPPAAAAQQGDSTGIGAAAAPSRCSFYESSLIFFHFKEWRVSCLFWPASRTGQ